MIDYRATYVYLVSIIYAGLVATDTVNMICTRHKYSTLVALTNTHTHTHTHAHALTLSLSHNTHTRTIGPANELVGRYSSQELGSCQALYNKLLALDPSASFKEIHTLAMHYLHTQ